jgi:hypothetical protein
VPDGKNPQQFNRYAYGLNNPIKYRDPSGHAADAGGAGGGICDEHCRRVYQQLAQQAYQLAEAVGGMTDLSAPVTYQLTIYFQTIAIKYEHLSEGDSVTALNQQGAENSLHQWLAINGVFGDYAARQAESDALVPVYAVGSLQMNNNLSALYRNWALQDMPSSMASSSMASGAAPCNSFSGDTLVATDEGEQPIVTLRIGDVVLAYNEGLGRTGWYTVTGVWVHDDPVIEYVTIDGERIETTPEHPFFTEEYGWQSAVELRIGTHVRNADGNYGIVQTIQFAFRTQPMYNLTVEGAHTFFVGQHQWLVHNQCPLSAYQVADYVERNGGNPPPGYRGGTVFQNDGRGGGQRLSSLDVDGNRITYREYDVNPYAPGVNRGAERIVIGSDGE